MTVHNLREASGPARQGPAGARWFIGILYAFMAVVVASWALGWSGNKPNTVAGPAAHHTTTGAATDSGNTR